MVHKLTYNAVTPDPDNSTLTFTVSEGWRIWIDDYPVDVEAVHPDGRCALRLAERPILTALVDDTNAWVIPPGVAVYVSSQPYLPGDQKLTRLNFYARKPKAPGGGVKILTDAKKHPKPTIGSGGVFMTTCVSVAKIRGDHVVTA